MIYLDNAATTKNSPGSCRGYASLFQRILRKSIQYLCNCRKSKEAITKGREQIANVLGAKPEEIYFTAGGSESDNWALKATFEAYKNKGNHIITTKIEHHAILHTCEYLEKERGAKITYIGVDENGVVNLDELEAAITPETILISVMAANNEIGTIQPIKEIGRIAKNTIFYSTQMPYRHLARSRSMWMSAILICSVPAVIRLTDRKESASFTSERV